MTHFSKKFIEKLDESNSLVCNHEMTKFQIRNTSTVHYIPSTIKKKILGKLIHSQLALHIPCLTLLKCKLDILLWRIDCSRANSKHLQAKLILLHAMKCTILSNVCFSDHGAPVGELHVHPSELFHNGMISSKLLPYLSMPVSLFHQQLFHCLWCHSHQLVSSYVCWMLGF